MNGQKKPPKGGEWHKHKSKTSNRFYYYNPHTLESYWEKPEGVEILDMTASTSSNKNTVLPEAKYSEEECDEDELYRLLCTSSSEFKKQCEAQQFEEKNEEVLRRIKNKEELDTTQISSKGIKRQLIGANKQVDSKEKYDWGGNNNEITRPRPNTSVSGTSNSVSGASNSGIRQYLPQRNIEGMLPIEAGDMSCPQKRFKRGPYASVSGPSTSVSEASTSWAKQFPMSTKQITEQPLTKESDDMKLFTKKIMTDATNKEDLFEFIQQCIDNTLQDKFNKKGQALPRKQKQKKSVNRQEELNHTKVSKTPIQDRYIKQREDLLQKQNLKSPLEKQELPKIHKNVSKTPIQDRYYKLKTELTKNKNLKNNLETEPELIKRPSVHERIGWNPNIKGETVNQMVGNNSSSDNQSKSKPSPNKNVEIKKHQSPHENGVLISDFDSSLLNTRKRQFVTPPKDLRTKLCQRQKSSQVQDSAQSRSSYSEMEWEDIAQNDPLHLQDNSFEKLKEKSVSSSPVPVQYLPRYNLIYLVFDTSGILGNVSFVEKSISTGMFLDLPIKLIIPFALLRELDRLKLNMSVDGPGLNARALNRIFGSLKQNRNISIQEGSKSREAVGKFELKNNDDEILNCCLQIRQTCEEGEIAFLITGDNNQASKAQSFNLETYDMAGFKKWARKYSEDLRCQSLELSTKNDSLPSFPTLMPNDCYNNGHESMDVDTCPFETRVPAIIEPSNSNQMPFMVNERLSMDSNTEVYTTADLKNCIRSHVDELKIEFQAFLHNILDEATKKSVMPKDHKTNIKPSWTLIEYIIELRRRWLTIMSSELSTSMNKLFSKFVAVLKRYNADKEVLISKDVDMIFSLCSLIADLFSRKYEKPTANFLKKLYDLEIDWKEEYDKVSSSSISEDVLVQPVYLAVENINTCLQSDYEHYKTLIENVGIQYGNEDYEMLLCLYEKVATLKAALKSALEKNSAVWTCTDKPICDIHKIVANFSNGRGTSFGFELNIENVVELFQDKSYRENVQQMLIKYEQLQKKVDVLIDLCKDA